MRVASTPSIERLLRIRQVLARIPVSRSTWWLWVRNGQAPQPLKVGRNVTCWRESEIERFIDEVAARDQGAA